MSKFWSAQLRDLHPYSPGEQPRVSGLIKLNTNEHPLPPSQRVMTALTSVDGDALRRYPDPDSRALCRAIADREGLSPEQVFVGNGSDEVLAHVFKGLLTSQSQLLIPDITYSFYPVWARLYQLPVVELPLDSDFAINLDGYLEQPGAIMFANPNAPTGIALDPGALGDAVQSNPDRLFVVDEAYYGFGADSMAGLVNSVENLVVTRSLSKSHALAGLRVGYALAAPGLIEGLRRVKDSFNSYPLDALAQAGALAAVEDADWLRQASAEVTQQRDTLLAGLTGLGFEVCPSAGNFVFARHPECAGSQLFDHLREHNILVRRWDKPRIADHLRITVGSTSDCNALLACLAAKVGDAGSKSP